jgi:hypothetical protein
MSDTSGAKGSGNENRAWQRNHYIPRKQLLRFADGDGAIWVHDATKADSYCTRVNSVGVEVGMYSERVETDLNTVVEGPTHHIFDKINKRLPLTHEDRCALAKYITVMWRRVPAGRQRALNLMPGVADEVESELMDEFDACAKADSTLQGRVDALKAEAAVAFAGLKESPPARIWYESFNLHEVGEGEASLLSMRWVFLCSDDRQFLLSDDPVFFFAHQGIGHPESELTFPISSSVALWATRLPGPEMSYVRASANGVKQINRRTAYNSDRFVFSRTNEAWIKPFAMKREWDIQRLK